ncbi:MAG: Mur ligase family protein [Candidatus Saccharibacteria bacterium]|nr:Mur ligase family protein [Candidatus Saccharibacteria bacterium]
MHLYIAGINGAGMSALAEITHQLGHQVSGSDLKHSEFMSKIQNWHPKPMINIGQTENQISKIHKQSPIDWYIYSSALSWVKPPNEELAWAKQYLPKVSKRDEFFNFLIKKQNLKLLAISGSHGKTTTTAMLIWASQQLNLNISYAVGGRLADQSSAHLSSDSRWFIYEADEFDRNFLAFKPDLSVITGVEHDHQEVYPTKASYYQAMIDFIKQSHQVIMHYGDWQTLNQFQNLEELNHITFIPKIIHSSFRLLGEVNRLNAEVVRQTIKIWQNQTNDQEIMNILNKFPSLWRRFEQIAPSVYTDYAHNIAKIQGCLQIASELKKPLAIIYEPHSNVRQHHIQNQYINLFKSIDKLYWLPTYLAREDDDLPILSPDDLTKNIKYPPKIIISKMNEQLVQQLKKDIENRLVIVGMTAGNLDTWLRQNFRQD